MTMVLGAEPYSAPMTPESGAVLRRLDCVAYDLCLGVAVDRHWPGFHCLDCGGYRPIEAEQRRSDAYGLLSISVQILRR